MGNSKSARPGAARTEMPASGQFAGGPALEGFLYQITYALLLLLEAGPDKSIYLEKTDDISLVKDGSTTGQLQVKHHRKKRSLGDASPDLWKTLHNWSVYIRKGAADPSTQTLTLVTTSAVRDGTVAAMLGPDRHRRNVKRALDRLVEVARKSASTTNKKYYDEFTSLDANAQRRLLDSVCILGSEPDLQGIKAAVRKKLELPSPEGKLDAFVERIEGWWYDRAIKSLHEDIQIAYVQLKRQIDYVRNGFDDDNLPIEYADEPLPDGSTYEERTFVKQLEIINVHDRRKRRAKLDYYRASEQRLKWAADELLLVDELEKYDKKLCEMWSEQFGRMEEKLSGRSDDAALIAAGQDHYTSTIDMDIPIRRNVSDRYVMRGSMHKLSDELKIGWHPNFAQILGATGRATAA